MTEERKVELEALRKKAYADRENPILAVREEAPKLGAGEVRQSSLVKPNFVPELLHVRPEKRA